MAERPGYPAAEIASPCQGRWVTLKRPFTVTKEALAVAATDIRPKITMACNVCKHRNYITRKNRRNDPDRMELKKFCPNCRTHTAHRETR